MASSLLSKLYRPSLLAQLVSCGRVNLSLKLPLRTNVCCVQVSLRLTAGLPGKLVIGSRLCSSDTPAGNISRYPVPSKKDLPSDIVELMEEVEAKVQSSGNNVFRIDALFQCRTVSVQNSAFPHREDFCRMSSKSSPTDRQSSEPSSPTMTHSWAKRQVCICVSRVSSGRCFLTEQVI